MTSPHPTLKRKGLDRSREESNFVPFCRFPFTKKWHLESVVWEYFQKMIPQTNKNYLFFVYRGVGAWLFLFTVTRLDFNTDHHIFWGRFLHLSKLSGRCIHASQTVFVFGCTLSHESLKIPSTVTQTHTWVSEQREGGGLGGRDFLSWQEMCQALGEAKIFLKRLLTCVMNRTQLALLGKSHTC